MSPSRQHCAHANFIFKLRLVPALLAPFNLLPLPPEDSWKRGKLKEASVILYNGVFNFYSKVRILSSQVIKIGKSQKTKTSSVWEVGGQWTVVISISNTVTTYLNILKCWFAFTKSSTWMSNRYNQQLKRQLEHSIKFKDKLKLYILTVWMIQERCCGVLLNRPYILK